MKLVGVFILVGLMREQLKSRKLKSNKKDSLNFERYSILRR